MNYGVVPNASKFELVPKVVRHLVWVPLSFAFDSYIYSLFTPTDSYTDCDVREKWV